MHRLKQLDRVLSVRTLVVGLVALALATLFLTRVADSSGFPENVLDRLPTLASAEE